MAKAAEIEVTDRMVEAGLDALLFNRVDPEIETLEDCREAVRQCLLAGLRVHQLPG